MTQQSFAESASGTKCPTSLLTSRLPALGPSSRSTGKQPGNGNGLDPENISGFDLPDPMDDFSNHDLLFFSSLYTRGVSQSTEDLLCFSPASASNALSSPTESFSAINATESSGGPDYTYTSKITKRQAQNREAQRRFRERREQERNHLLSLLQKLSAENNRVSALLEQSREKYLTLEARTKQLQTEADILRRWRSEMMDSMAGLSLVHQREQLAEEVLEAVAGSCSNECWREGIRRTRAFIVLQTLAGLFAGVEEGGANGVRGLVGVADTAGQVM
ncbi:hypothetical protein BJX68DRAFT_269067 [Aspergillus pseudodeflectus]|uniref:BZIP domain-containing protein n=1 Tax=Aspergillus pseudodeflectus TaxID=176178 RepID=A0ABR4JZM9_9EURO